MFSLRVIRIIQGFLLFTVISASSQAAEILGKTGLLEKLDLDGEISVIVTVDSVAAKAQLKSQSMSDAIRISRVAGLQSQLLTSLNVNDYRALHRFQYVPQISLRVNRQAFNTLQAIPGIVIVENKMMRTSLQQSMPRVFSNQQVSDYTGNNQWAVAIIDTGVDKNHSFLKTGSKKKVISEACYSGFDGAFPGVVQSFCPGGALSSTATGSGVPCTLSIDGCDHGTHVAGIAAGDGASFDGAARLGKVIAIKVFSRINGFLNCYPFASPCINASESDIIKGLERVYALRNTYKIAAANLSLGGGAFSGTCNGEPEKPIIDRLKAVKIATIVASGNAGESAKISSPACISTAIAVGSSLDDADVRSSFSNNSSTLDLYAPGSNITSSVPGNKFAEFNGTSMSAPHVAGAWAVIRHALPNATVNQIESAFKQVGPAIRHNGVSRRRIDIRAALKSLGIEENIVVIAPIIQLLILE